MRFDPVTRLLVRQGTRLLEHAVLRVLWDVKCAITPSEIARQATLFVNTTPGQKSNSLTQGVLDVLDQQGFVSSEETHVPTRKMSIKRALRDEDLMVQTKVKSGTFFYRC